MLEVVNEEGKYERWRLKEVEREENIVKRSKLKENRIDNLAQD